MLFDPARHEQPNGAAWDAGRAHEAIDAIVRDIERLQHGQGRYSLWTGDPGLAVFLWHCIVGEAAMPALDALV